MLAPVEIAGGAQVAWLIDPYKREVHVDTQAAYRLVKDGPSPEGDAPVAGFALELGEVWNCYEL